MSVPVHQMSLFNYHKRGTLAAPTWELTSEDSLLSAGGSQSVYGAIKTRKGKDMGFAVKSAQTGVEHTFRVSHYVRGSEELLAVELTPLDSECPVTKITVFND